MSNTRQSIIDSASELVVTNKSEMTPEGSEMRGNVQLRPSEYHKSSLESYVFALSRMWDHQRYPTPTCILSGITNMNVVASLAQLFPEFQFHAYDPYIEEMDLDDIPNITTYKTGISIKQGRNLARKEGTYLISGFSLRGRRRGDLIKDIETIVYDSLIEDKFPITINGEYDDTVFQDKKMTNEQIYKHVIDLIDKIQIASVRESLRNHGITVGSFKFKDSLQRAIEVIASLSRSVKIYAQYESYKLLKEQEKLVSLIKPVVTVLEFVLPQNFQDVNYAFVRNNSILHFRGMQIWCPFSIDTKLIVFREDINKEKMFWNISQNEERINYHMLLREKSNIDGELERVIVNQYLLLRSTPEETMDDTRYSILDLFSID